VSERTRGLGKGLSALLGESDAAVPRVRAPAAEKPAEPADKPRGPQTLPIELLRPNPAQPRRVFVADEIEALATSIRQKGVLQPILVRPADGGLYEIVAGERRWRAAQKAGLHEIPAFIRVLNDEETLEIAIIENVQRLDLTPLEEAQAYRVLHDEFGRTQAQVADLVGKSRAHVANMMRLLDLPPPVRMLLESGALSAGHARALLGARNAEVLAQEVVRRGLNVRQTEALVKKGDAPTARVAAASRAKDPDIAALEADLESSLGLSIALHDSGGGKGELRLKYETLEQLDDLCRRLTGG
jgi:ParB family chromosome partitioning protein